MKTHIILFAVLFMGLYAPAQKSQKVEDKTFHEVIHSNLVPTPKHLVWKPQQISTKRKENLARLYKYKNSRIKRALSFSTPRDKAKLA